MGPVPIFEYRCDHCGHRFEAIVLDGRQPDECPRCEQPDLRKQISTFAAHVSGSGSLPSAPAACGSCGDPRGPGSCRMH
jgi:putative FmdB family regulatory protein